MTDHTILLVDDSADDRELFLRACEKARFKYKVDVARDGQEALDYLFGRGDFARRKATPAMVILDMKMPRINGLEALRVIRADARLKHLMAVILTSSDEERDRTAALALGATLYLNKPLDFDGYLTMTKQIAGLLSHLR